MAYVIEDMWEKILSRSEEFKGRQVRLVILNEIDAGFDSPGQSKLYPLDAFLVWVAAAKEVLAKNMTERCTTGDEKIYLCGYQCLDCSYG